MVSDEELIRIFSDYSVDHDNAAHFRGRLEHRLLINQCGACGHFRHPPRSICPKCHSSDIRATDVSGAGRIHLVTFLHRGPPAEGVNYSTPYPVATIELDEQPGLRFTSTIVGGDNAQIEIGRRVRLDWLARGAEPLPVFRLVPEECA